MTPYPLNRPEFTTPQLLSCVPGLSVQTFRTWNHRGVFVLMDAERVGTGKAQLFSARDVIQAATFHELSRLNLSVAKAGVVWAAVQGRLLARLYPPPGEVFNVSAAFCSDPATGDLVMRAFREQGDLLALDHPDAPDALVVLRMDRLIARVLGRLDALQAGLASPPEPNPTRGEDPDPFRVWATDAQGRRVYVGLTFEETAELARLEEENRPEDADREVELHHKRELARMTRVVEEIAARSREEGEGP